MCLFLGPLEKTGEIHIPYKPDIDIEKIRFQRFSFEETVAILHLKLENKNDFDLGLKALEYEVWLSDVSEVQNCQNLLPLLKMVLVTLIFPSPSRLKTLDLLFGT